MPRLIHQDIIDQVISALRDDRATLLRCCTVSHSFLIPSRKQLFFDLTIPHFYSGTYRYLNSLIHVLSIHPEYISYIRVLRLERLEIETIEKPCFIRLIKDIADRRALRVFRLEIRHAWEALSVPIQTALTRLFQSPTLHTIVSHMCGYTFPVHVLGLATGLRHLNFICDHRLSCCHPTDVSPVILPLPSPASPDIYLESLQIIFETNAPALVGYLSRPDCPLKISQLRQLQIHSNYRLPTAAETVMKGASRSLESLIWILHQAISAHQSGEAVRKLMFEFSGIVPESDQLDPSIIQDLMSLRRLTFGIYDDRSAIDWIESGLGVPPKLEELNILYQHWEEGYDSDVEALFERQLQRDDKRFGLMYASGRFPCLRSINIMLAVHPVIEEDTLEMCLRSRMPFIHGTGMLVVNVGEYPDGLQFLMNASIVSRG